jgi:hypothetical protein
MILTAFRPNMTQANPLRIMNIVRLFSHISRCLWEYIARFRRLWRVSKLSELPILPCPDIYDSAECRKCGKILASFIDPQQAFGLDKVIPLAVLANAKVRLNNSSQYHSRNVLTSKTGTCNHNSVQGRLPRL